MREFRVEIDASMQDANVIAFIIRSPGVKEEPARGCARRWLLRRWRFDVHVVFTDERRKPTFVFSTITTPFQISSSKF
jgi:hypothetical protein